MTAQRIFRGAFGRAVLVGAALAMSAASAGRAADSDTIDRLRSGDGVLKLGYRTDAAPFAFEENGEPKGYSVALCREISAAATQAITERKIRVSYVPVSVDTRFDALEKGEIDILCGATTVTMSRRETMDFSLLTFVTGGVLLVPKTDETFGVAQTIGVLGGTTSEAALNRIMALSGEAAEIVPVEAHEAGVAALKNGAVDAYFGDRAILLGIMRDNPGAFSISENVRTFEPYALAMRRGEDDLRLLVDKTLARLYREGGITRIYRNAFGDARPGSGLVAIYNLMALADDE